MIALVPDPASAQKANQTCAVILIGSCTMARTTTSRTRSPDLEARWAVIRQRLEPHAEVLASRGSLVAKQARGRRVWAVRFVVADGGRPIHRSIFIGGDER
ncbi:MAG TPA: hypothetical protein VGH33_00965, partial [Isosphaeraceae bacterium]